MLGLDQSTGELDAVVSEYLVGDAIGAERLGEGQADLASGGPAHHLGQHAKARMVVDPGHHLALGAIGQEDPRDDVVLPQLHRDVALPAHIGVSPALAGDGGDQVVAHEHPIDGGSRRHGGDPPLGQPIDQGPRSIAGVLTAQLQMAASSVGLDLGRMASGLVAPVDQRTDPVAPISPDPGMHALAGHPITLGHLGDRDLGLENLHDCLVALLHDAQLHQHRLPPLPSTNQTVRVQPEEKCQASSGARVSSIKRNPAPDQTPDVSSSLRFKPPSARPAASPPPASFCTDSSRPSSGGGFAAASAGGDGESRSRGSRRLWKEGTANLFSWTTSRYRTRYELHEKTLLRRKNCSQGTRLRCDR